VRGGSFALAVLPLHYFYYVLNFCSASLGFLLHHFVGEPHPRPDVQAFAEMGVVEWPPVPRRGEWNPWSGAGRAPDEGAR
jgi:hypothetical protein